MTDKDIIKALEWCKNYEDCSKCHYIKCLTDKGCLGELLTDTLALINRQQAEIERLKEFIVETRRCDKELKAEAVKEFAERLKNKKARYNADYFYVIDYIPSKEIDNLAKEMIGE